MVKYMVVVAKTVIRYTTVMMLMAICGGGVIRILRHSVQ